MDLLLHTRSVLNVRRTGLVKSDCQELGFFVFSDNRAGNASTGLSPNNNECPECGASTQMTKTNTFNNFLFCFFYFIFAVHDANQGPIVLNLPQKLIFL